MEMELLRRHPRRRWLPRRSANKLPVRLRLSLLMLLLYAAPGAIVPLFTLRLQELGFSPIEMSLCCATQALATMLAPLLAGQIADRPVFVAHAWLLRFPLNHFDARPDLFHCGLSVLAGRA